MIDPAYNLVPETNPETIRAFAEHYTEKPSCELPVRKCTWGRGRIKRFIAGYVRVFKDRHFPGRKEFLEQHEAYAREHGVKLPTAEEIYKNSHKRTDTFISGLVDANDTRVSTFKYYRMGDRYVAYIPGENKQSERTVYEKTHWDELFDFHYRDIRNKYKIGKGIIPESMRPKIEAELIYLFRDGYEYNDETEQETCYEFISRKIYNSVAAYCGRMRLFHRKKEQTQWTAWWTISYDDKLFSSEKEFRKALLKFLSNKADPRRGNWRVMGVFEHGEDNGRLHFHGFFYIPNDTERDKLVEVERYSKKRGCKEKYWEHPEIRAKFGINKYEDIREAMQSDITAMANYTSKMCRYMEKGEKVFYSRHLPTEFMGDFRHNDMVMFFNIKCKGNIKRYVINDAIMTRTATTITRRIPIEEQELYDVGLIDESA